MVEMDKVFKKHGPYHPTKKQRDWYTNICKQVYCNETCDGYTMNKNLKMQTKNGFNKIYKKDKINKLKERGALSGCVDVVDYDVFHK